MVCTQWPGTPHTCTHESLSYLWWAAIDNNILKQNFIWENLSDQRQCQAPGPLCPWSQSRWWWHWARWWGTQWPGWCCSSCLLWAENLQAVNFFTYFLENIWYLSHTCVLYVNSTNDHEKYSNYRLKMNHEVFNKTLFLLDIYLLSIYRKVKKYKTKIDNYFFALKIVCGKNIALIASIPTMPYDRNMLI